MPEIAELQFIEGPQAGQSVRLIQPCTTIGRSESSDVVLEDAFASRLHAKVVAQGEGYVLVNLSRNGTKVNRKWIKERHLRDGDVVALGAHTKVRYVVHAQPAAVISHAPAESEALGAGLLTEDEPQEVPAVVDARRSLLKRPKVLAALGVYLAGIAGLAMWLSLQSDPKAVQRPAILTKEEIGKIFGEQLERPVDVRRAREELQKARSLAATAHLNSRNLYPALMAFKEARAFSPQPLGVEDRKRYEGVKQKLVDKVYEYYFQGRQRTETRRYGEARREFRTVLLLVPDENHPVNINVRRHIEYLDYLRRRR